MTGNRIQQARQAAGLSLRALAGLAGVTAIAISRYENNQSPLTFGLLMELSQKN